MDGNYIKIYRSLLEWEWYSNINTKVLFLHMLLKANWKDGKFQGTTVPRGSFVSSYPRLAEECDLTINEIRTALKHLVSTGEVTVRTHSKFSVFAVNNYNQYQDINSQITDNAQADNRQVTGNAQSVNSLLTTIEEGKKEKKERREEGKKKEKEVPNGTKKEKSVPVYYPNDELLNQAFQGYVEMRKQIKKPLTERAITLAMTKLRKLSTPPLSEKMDNEIAIKILEESTFRCWQGLFPLKDNTDGRQENKQNGIDWSKV